METCPRCQSHFPASKTWISPPLFRFLTGWGFGLLNINVKCPSCKKVFPAKEHHFFGLFSPRKFRIYYAVLTALIIFLILLMPALGR